MRRLTTLVPLLFALPLSGGSSVIGQDKQPGDRISVAVDAGGQKTVLSFRFCPGGTIIPGEPQDKPNQPDPTAAPADGSLTAEVQVSSFFMAETEVTVAQFMAIAGPEVMDLLKQRAAKFQGAKEDVQLLNQPSEHPIFMVSPREAFAFCRSLNALQGSTEQVTASKLEQLRYRLPSHVEWQYACRALRDSAEQSTLPHFNNWVAFSSLDNADRARCLEEWKEMGQAEADFAGTQAQVIEILKGRDISTNPKPLQILTAFLQAATKTTRDYATTRPGKLNRVGQTRENLWGLSDMHGNVSEWTIGITDRGAMQSFWTSVAEADQVPANEASQKVWVLAGGSAYDIMAGGNSAIWQPFTIWGGRPASPEGLPIPFSITDDDDNSYTFDYAPGMRLVMERALADDWLLVLSREIVGGDAAGSAEFLTSCRTSLNVVVPAASKQQVELALQYYDGIAAYRQGQQGQLVSALAAIDGLSSAAKPKKLDFSNFLARPGSAKPAAANAEPDAAVPRSDDQEYFAMLPQMIALDQR